MKTTLIEFHHKTAILLTFLGSVLATPQIGIGQAAGHAHEVIPLIQMESVPLVDAIQNLARMEGINYLLNPRLSSTSVGPGSSRVNLRWTNITAQEALCRLLSEHQLAMFTNPATSIIRISFTNQPVRPVPASLGVGKDTSPVIPLISIADVPLADAIRNLARQAKLQLVFDPALPVPSPGPATTMSQCQVSVRFEKITPRQALLELLDNYDLVIVPDDPSTSSFRIITKEQAEAGSAQKPGQEKR